MKNYCLNKLIEKSDYIQSLCVNNQSSNPGDMFWEHHFPLKDEQGSWTSSENWDLPEDTVKTILVFEEELLDYAKDVIAHSNDKSFGIPWILPPWVVFPIYSLGSSAWKMGFGQIYTDCFHKFFQNLSEPEKDLYNMNYEKPRYFTRM
jgi:hypothetical protein